jgi:hypothetical protein
MVTACWKQVNCILKTYKQEPGDNNISQRTKRDFFGGRQGMCHLSVDQYYLENGLELFHHHCNWFDHPHRT